jgi:PAS domain S-box-containing protein
VQARPSRTQSSTVAIDQSLVESPDRFEMLVESIVEYGIFMLDAGGHVTSWNSGAANLHGYSAEEMLGRHCSILYPQTDVPAGKCERELEVATRAGRFQEEGWRVRRDGSTFWASVVITTLRDAAGRVVGFGEVIQDLSARQRAEEELRRSEERLRLLVASVKDYAIFILDPAGYVATWNPGAERLKGYTAEEIIGTHFSRFYPQSDVKAGKCELELDGAQRYGRFEDEGWRIRKDGSRFWANVVITPIRDANDALVGFAKVTRDLTERRNHEEERIVLARTEEARRIAEEHSQAAQAMAAELRRARDKAEEGTRLKDEFLAVVSHELRTPLNAILGWGRMLQSGALPSDKVGHAIDTIVRNAAAQNQIIDDLLDVSRIVTGQLRLDLDFIDINQVIGAAIDIVLPRAEAGGVTVDRVINPDVGVIKADAGRMQQVIWNLLSNAVKFTPRGGRVDVLVHAHGATAEIEVRDTGRGIAPEFLHRVFDRFTQQEGVSTRRTGGLGLGLAIVKHLVELHGGTVQAESAGEGRGSTFRVELPLVAARRSSAEQQAHDIELDEVRYPLELRGLKVLVVDDEVDARELVQEILERGGAHVTLAASSAEALATICREKPDLIISDIGMPGEDGYCFMTKLRALSREEGGRTPAVALTAYARAEDRRKALLAGFQNHASKPVEPQELVMVAANLVGRYA